MELHIRIEPEYTAIIMDGLEYRLQYNGERNIVARVLGVAKWGHPDLPKSKRSAPINQMMERLHRQYQLPTRK